MSPTPESDRWDAGTNQVGRNVGPPHAAVLRGRYDEYCRQQVTLLLEIVPREAVRTLYRSARSWATREGLHESKDPMSTLRAFCRELLPLPPFEIWLSDFEHHRLALADINDPGILARPTDHPGGLGRQGAQPFLR